MFTPAKRLIIMGGRRYKNIATNGNFNNGIDGWSGYNSTISVVNGECAAIGVAVKYVGVMNSANLGTSIVGHKYYYASRVCATDNDAQDLRAFFRAGGNLYTDGATKPAVNGSFVLVSNILTAESAGNISLYASARYVAPLIAGRVVKIDDIVAIDLTAEFGAGNEPSKVWCDANIVPNIIY